MRKCKKGHEDWYEKGSYRRCRVCHSEATLRSYHNQKISSARQRKQKHKSRPLAQDMKRLFPAALEKRLRTECSKGHSLNQENVRLETDSKGRIHRRCRKCENIRNRKKYGLQIQSSMADMLRATDNPWDRVG